MKVYLLSWLLRLLALAPATLAASRESVLQAQAWLGPEIPTRVIRIENGAAGPSRYPAEFHGLVIAFADILWLYNEFDGTQNLSFKRGRVAADEANLGALLQAADPHWRSFSEEHDLPVSPRKTALPANGCFIACLARWRELGESEHSPVRGRLLAYFAAEAGSGHMVLEYWRNGRRYVFDPSRPRQPVRLPRRLGEEPLAVATAVTDAWRLQPPSRASAVEIRPLSPRALLAGDTPPSQPRS